MRSSRHQPSARRRSRSATAARSRGWPTASTSRAGPTQRLSPRVAPRSRATRQLRPGRRPPPAAAHARPAARRQAATRTADARCRTRNRAQALRRVPTGPACRSAMPHGTYVTAASSYRSRPPPPMPRPTPARRMPPRSLQRANSAQAHAQAAARRPPEQNHALRRLSSVLRTKVQGACNVAKHPSAVHPRLTRTPPRIANFAVLTQQNTAYLSTPPPKVRSAGGRLATRRATSTDQPLALKHPRVGPQRQE